MVNGMRGNAVVLSIRWWIPVLAIVLMIGGCEMAGYLAHGIGGGEKKVNVKAAYTGLDHQNVAVVVSLPAHAAYRYPNARLSICRSVSRHLVQGVEGIKVADPGHVVAFQEKHPDWISLPYGELVYRLNVDRVVLVDIGEYSMSEPGNAHTMQGTIIANVGVIEAAEANAPKRGDQYVFQHTIEAKYPKNSSVGGMINIDEQTMEVATISEFATMAANLFYKHKEVR